MESDRFDALIREACERATRRGVMRTGLGIIAATFLTATGLATDDAAARRNRNKRLRRRRRRRRKDRNRCTGNRPVICGDGCCPENYPQCCDDASDATNSFSCNPPSANCCPLDQGGGSCDLDFPVCCEATPQQPFGSCAQVDGVCCPGDLGGGTCRSDEPVCCPDSDDPLLRVGYCCPVDSTCCADDTDCPSNECRFGCCQPEAMSQRETPLTHGSRISQQDGNRFHMPAR